MGIYLEDEELWKCSKHPSKRRRTGICPTCLYDRLNTLCPHCATVLPCSCSAVSAAASAAGGLKRSRSVAIPFLRSRSRFSAGGGDSDCGGGLPRSRSARWFWSMFKSTKSNQNNRIKKPATITKSRSVAVSAAADGGDVGGGKKSRVWNFVSPMKAFRQSNRNSRILQEVVACA